MKKILFSLGLVALLAAGCGSTTATNTNIRTSAVPPTEVPAQIQPPAPATPGDTTDASLNSSLSSIDGQMSSLNSDSANMDSSIAAHEAPTK